MNNDVMIAIIDDSLLHVCIYCGKSLPLTQKQYDAYKREAGEKKLVFECSSCYAAKVKDKRAKKS